MLTLYVIVLTKLYLYQNVPTCPKCRIMYIMLNNYARLLCRAGLLEISAPVRLNNRFCPVSQPNKGGRMVSFLANYSSI